MSYDGWGSKSTNTSTAGSSQHRSRTPVARATWWRWNSWLRLYGVIFLAGTKTADAVTTAVGLLYVPGIVELNPVADTMFVDSGTIAGLVVLSFATVISTTLIIEWLAVTMYRRLGMARLALLVKITVYGGLSLLFGMIAVNNALLISEQVHAFIADLFVLSA